MYQYATLVYIGLSFLLSMCYSSIEVSKNKGSLDNMTRTIMIGWCIASLIVASVIAGISGEAITGFINPTHLIVGLILACTTLIISSCMVVYA
jgi:hypothetical protein